MKELCKKCFWLLFILISLFSCKKDDDKQQQEEEGSLLTVDEKSFLQYQIGDSLVFGRYYYDDFIEDSVSYKITSRSETDHSIEYYFIGIKDYDGSFLIEKEEGELNFILTFKAHELVPIVIEKVTKSFERFTMNDHIFTDVLLIEKDSSQNSQHHCNINRAYVSKNNGFIQIQKDCFVFKLVETY